jgi:hypothetical protein
MSGGQLNANVEQYLQAAAMNTPPPTIVSDPLVVGVTPVEQLLRVLGLAANLGDPQDNTTSAEQHAERDLKTTEAAEKFAAQDEQAAVELSSVAPHGETATQTLAAGTDQTAAMSQQLPQMASGIAGALAGAVGGALQPLAQIPQQAAQGMQQAMQTGMGLFQQTAGEATLPIDDASLAATPFADDFAGGAGGLAGLGEAGGGGGGGELGALGGGGGGFGGTAPVSFLGPPAIPSASTAPSSAPIIPVAAPSTPHIGPMGGAGMAGMPMVPPGAMGGVAGADKDAKPDTKRVSVPPVRNGAPVQGRLTVPPSPPTVTKNVDGKPVITRRIITPKSADDSKTGDTNP